MPVLRRQAGRDRMMVEYHQKIDARDPEDGGARFRRAVEDLARVRAYFPRDRVLRAIEARARRQAWIAIGDEALIARRLAEHEQSLKDEAWLASELGRIGERRARKPGGSR